MSKTFRAWKIDEPLFLPPMVQDFVAKDHLARFVLSLVRDDLGLAEITGRYGSERGQPPFDPVMMTALLLYSYCRGVYSSRRIAGACRERVDFMSIVALDAPDFRTVSEFRGGTSRHWARCLRKSCICARPPAWSSSVMSRLMAPRSKPTLRSTRR